MQKPSDSLSILVLSRDVEDYVRAVKEWLPDEVGLFFAREVSELDEVARNCEVVLGEPDRVAAALPQLSNVRWIQSTWAGITPLLPAVSQGIAVSGIKGVFGTQMAEYILAYLLEHQLQLPARRRAQKHEEWFDQPTGSLAGKTLGVMGTGSIGAEIARCAGQLGMHCIGYSRRGSAVAGFCDVFAADQIGPFLSRCEFLVGVLPDTQQTRGLLNSRTLAKLPNEAMLINVGRGSLIDETALIQALQSGALSAAVLDVFNHEPLPAGHPFWATPGLTVTAHIAARSWPLEIAKIFQQNVQRYREGLSPRYLVDPRQGY